METVDDVLDGLESGVQHAFQAGIDRVNQNAKTLSHEIKDWRIMPQPFTYAVSIIHFATFYIKLMSNSTLYFIYLNQPIFLIEW